MKILIISHLYYPTIGGVQNVIENYSRQFIKSGHSVEIITSRHPKNLPRSDIIDGIKVTRLPFRLPELKIMPLFKFIVRAIDCTISLLFFTKKSFDFINLHYVSENAPYAIFLSKILRVPLISSIHGADIEDFASRNRLNRYLVKKTLKSSSKIIVNSNYMLGKVTEMFGGDFYDKSVVIANGIELEQFNNLECHHEDVSPYILGIGRFVPKKGFDILIKAFSLVVDRFQDLKLVLIGDGPEKSKLEALIRDLSLEQSIQMYGLVTHEETLAFFPCCRFFVLPSRKEPFGIVNLEAMTAQKAVIAMDVGGVADYLSHMENGLLVKEQRPEALGDAIIFLFEHPDLALQFGRNGRKMVEDRFTWGVISDQFIETVESVLYTEGRS